MISKQQLLQHIIDNSKENKITNPNVYVDADVYNWRKWRDFINHTNIIYLNKYKIKVSQHIYLQTRVNQQIIDLKYKGVEYRFDFKDSEMFPLNLTKSHKFFIVLYRLLNKTQ